MSSKTFTPTCQYFYTDISVISVTFLWMGWMVLGWVRYRTPLTVLINTWWPLSPAKKYLVGEHHRDRTRWVKPVHHISAARRTICSDSNLPLLEILVPLAHLVHNGRHFLFDNTHSFYFRTTNHLHRVCRGRRGHLRLHTAAITAVAKCGLAQCGRPQ